MTKIIFSDGSKQLAHNLDDQYERWRLRRESLSEVDQRHDVARFSEMLIPALDVTTLSYEDCGTQKTYLLQLKPVLNERLMRLRTDIQARVTNDVFRLKMAEMRAVEHLDHRAGIDIDLINRRISAIRKENPDLVPPRYRAETNWLRYNLKVILKNINDETAVTMISDLLAHRYKSGDPGLFDGKELGIHRND